MFKNLFTGLTYNTGIHIHNRNYQNDNNKLVNNLNNKIKIYFFEIVILALENLYLKASLDKFSFKMLKNYLPV